MATQKQRAELSRLALRYGRTCLALRAAIVITENPSAKTLLGEETLEVIRRNEESFRKDSVDLSGKLLELAISIAEQEDVSATKAVRKRAKRGK